MTAYAFDKVFRLNIDTPEVYDVAARPVVKASMDGTIFSYGVTSSGKTHTMHTKITGVMERMTTCCEVMAILRKLPKETVNKLSAKGFFPQEGYILQQDHSLSLLEYGVNGANTASEFCAGDPVGVLAATAMSNPADKAVLDSSASSNSSWEMMKEILLCGVTFKNVISDRRVRLYLNNCDCGRKHCHENAALVVKNHLKKVTLKDTTIEFLIDECCSFGQSSKSKWTDVPCIQFILRETTVDIERASLLLDDKVCPVLLETIIKGDDRVASANIVWISPDKATWSMSPNKGPKGELALDIILEKKAVRKTGDAWRILMDTCLPIIHLIDTKCSIPYAIKQVQELLGISCAFEQVVQRLSTSVMMVTIGVLKDHLLLLANSMTCGGTLIGFNAGAAGKCHVDNLSSIVASCVWGKHVTVGTGSPFRESLGHKKG